MQMTSVGAIRIAVIVYAAVVAGLLVIACAGEVTYVAVPPDGGDGSAPVMGSDGGDGGADASVPDGSYVPDPTAQSANYQLNAAHTGATTDPSLYGTTSRRWEQGFPGQVAFPLIARGKVIVTFITADKHGVVQAFDAASGASVWGPMDLGASDIAQSVYDGGRVFALTRSGSLRAFDVDTGTPLWTNELGLPATPIQFLAPPAAHNGQLYVLPNNFGKAFAINEVTGVVLWKAAQFGGYAAPAVIDTGVFLAIGCKNVYRLDPATGAEAWHTTSNCGGSAETPVVYDQTLFLSQGGGVSRLDITTGAVSPSGTIGMLPPAIHDGIGFAPLNSSVYGVNLFGGGTGWKYESPQGSWFVRASPIVAGGKVYVLWDDCNVRALEPTTGSVVWSDSVPSECTSGPWAGVEGGSVAMAAAAGVIAVPFRKRLVVYGVEPIADAGTSDASDASTD